MITIADILMNSELKELIKKHYINLYVDNTHPYYISNPKIYTSDTSFCYCSITTENEIIINNFLIYEDKSCKLCNIIIIDFMREIFCIHKSDSIEYCIFKFQQESFEILFSNETNLTVHMPPKDSTTEEVLMQYSLQEVFMNNTMGTDFLIQSIDACRTFVKTFGSFCSIGNNQL